MKGTQDATAARRCGRGVWPCASSSGSSRSRRVVVEGLTARDGRRLLVYNPVYELQ